MYDVFEYRPNKAYLFEVEFVVLIPAKAQTGAHCLKNDEHHHPCSL